MSASQHTVNTWILLIMLLCHTEQLWCACVGHNAAHLSFRARCYCWLVYYSESRTEKSNIALVITWRLSWSDTFGHWEGLSQQLDAGRLNGHDCRLLKWIFLIHLAPSKAGRVDTYELGSVFGRFINSDGFLFVSVCTSVLHSSQ